MFDKEIIPDYVSWKNKNPNTYNWYTYLMMNSDVDKILGAAKIFSPEISKFEECHINVDSPNFSTFHLWKEKLKNDCTKIEAIVNRIVLTDLFPDDDKKRFDQVLALGNVMKYFWELTLKKNYPNENYNVETWTEDDEVFITLTSKK